MQEGYTGVLYPEKEKWGERDTGNRWQETQEQELGVGQRINGESQLAGIFHCDRQVPRQAVHLLKKPLQSACGKGTGTGSQDLPNAILQAGSKGPAARPARSLVLCRGEGRTKDGRQDGYSLRFLPREAWSHCPPLEGRGLSVFPVLLVLQRACWRTHTLSPSPSYPSLPPSPLL